MLEVKEVINKTVSSQNCYTILKQAVSSFDYTNLSHEILC